LSAAEILGPEAGFKVESMRVRFTHFDQEGRGYQSQAEKADVFSPGRESATIEQPQLELVAKDGKFTHRLWVPVDVVTAASPDALDVMSSASRTNEAGTFDLSTTYHRDRDTDIGIRAAFHVEEPFRSWSFGIGGARRFADGNTTIAASLNQTVDWLDRFNIFGTRLGRDYRSSTNANLGLTQLLSPTTVAHLDYGVTLQLGQLSNTWNAVPLATRILDGEVLPYFRHRHAFVARLAQALPWRGILKGSYRLYADNWGVVAHSIEVQLYQRFGPYFYLRANYRFHHQSSPFFWSSRADPSQPYRTADSDLAYFDAQTIGALAAIDLPMRRLQGLHAEFGYERYFRTNGLTANIYTCSLGFRF
jgi:hypothetical protein